MWCCFLFSPGVAQRAGRSSDLTCFPTRREQAKANLVFLWCSLGGGRGRKREWYTTLLPQQEKNPTKPPQTNRNLPSQQALLPLGALTLGFLPGQALAFSLFTVVFFNFYFSKIRTHTASTSQTSVCNSSAGKPLSIQLSHSLVLHGSLPWVPTHCCFIHHHTKEHLIAPSIYCKWKRLVYPSTLTSVANEQKIHPTNSGHKYLQAKQY